MAVFTQITGLPQVGAILTSVSTADNGELYQSVQWYTNTVESTTGGTEIAGATDLTFTTTAAQQSKWIYAIGTFDDSGPLTATSNLIGPIGQGGSKKAKKRDAATTGDTAPEPAVRKARKILLVDTTKWHEARRPKQ